jgi:hypothetical protein
MNLNLARNGLSTRLNFMPIPKEFSLLLIIKARLRILHKI